MDLVRGLRQEARLTAVRRGHELGRFSALAGTNNTWNIHSTAKCSRCYATVSVYPNPAPNGIDIAGLAVAANCPARA